MGLNKDLLAVVIYNLILLIGTVYLVQVCKWDPWWFLLTVCLLVNYKSTE